MRTVAKAANGGYEGGSAAIVTSVLVEALLLAAAGGILGALAAWLFLNGHTASTTQGSAYAQLIFDITVTVLSALGSRGLPHRRKAKNISRHSVSSIHCTFRSIS
jgi:hypothetical protein